MKQIKNLEFKIKNWQAGYTLIELLVVVIIITVVGTTIAGIITLSLRGSNRSINVNAIRQSGNFAVSQMTKMISYAGSFEGVANLVEDVDPLTKKISYHKQCADPNAQYKFLKITSFDQGTTTFICNSKDNSDDSNINMVASYSGSLDKWPIPPSIPPSASPQITKFIDTSKFDIAECYFRCSQENVSVAPTIDISFTIERNSSFAENKVSIPFDTTVGFRNDRN